MWADLVLTLSLCILPLASGLTSCGTGCLSPKLSPLALSSQQSFIEVTFASPYQNYAALPQASMAYGICYALGCNYRNMTVQIAGGDFIGRQDLIYGVTFYTQPGADVSVLPGELYQALYADNGAGAVGSVTYGFRGLTLGALGGYPTVYNGWGSFTVPSPSPPRLPPPQPHQERASTRAQAQVLGRTASKSRQTGRGC